MFIACHGDFRPHWLRMVPDSWHYVERVWAAISIEGSRRRSTELRSPASKLALTCESSWIARGREPAAFNGIIGSFRTAKNPVCKRVQQSVTAPESRMKYSGMLLRLIGGQETVRQSARPARSFEQRARSGVTAAANEAMPSLLGERSLESREKEETMSGRTAGICAV